ncbi:MAG: hypothetical protein ACRCX2_19420 [Paraclostridium sp.]
MGEKLFELNDIYVTDKETGEKIKLDVKQVDFNIEHEMIPEEDFRLLSECTGSFKITKYNKFELVKIVYQTDKSNEEMKRLYKHLKRCENRKRLHRR